MPNQVYNEARHASPAYLSAKAIAYFGAQTVECNMLEGGGGRRRVECGSKQRFIFHLGF